LPAESNAKQFQMRGGIDFCMKTGQGLGRVDRASGPIYQFARKLAMVRS
jgi:hypothetical protein